MRHEKTEKRFLNDIKEHEMTIIRNDDVDRHLRFSRPESSVYRFDIITWSGHLLITGDMGSWLFRRTHDMFSFFRMDKGDWNYEENGLGINPHYWEEKLLAVDARGGRDLGAKQYSQDLLEKVVRDIVDEWTEDWEENRVNDLWERLEEDVIYAETERDAHEAAANFEHDGFKFSDFWEHELREYTFIYLWCCYAVIWGIRKFDEVENARA